MTHNVLLIFLMVLSAWLTAELIKFILDFGINKKPDLRSFLGYGGFPSAHSALVSSLCFSILLVQGFDVVFIISLVLACVVIRDTISLRQYIDRNSEHIAKLEKHLSKEEIELEYISHSIMEILVGIAIGVVIPSILYLLL